MTEQLFFITSMPESRQADYYLGYLDGCVFIDFDNRDGDRICLRRISFDGYGCCELGEQANLMDTDDSIDFKIIYQDNLKDQQTLLAIIKKAIALNKQYIWTDALEEYELV